ncbi:hypothetical protein Tco_1184094 [Tanacetum coccineum]
MSDFKESSFHNNMGRRTMTLEEEEECPWNKLRCGNIDVWKSFLKLWIMKDPIWDKISCKLEEPSHDIHVDECPSNGKLTHVGLEHVYMYIACGVLYLFVASCSQEHLEGKRIRVYKFNLDYVTSIKWVVELPFNARLLSSTSLVNLLEVKQHVSTFVKEIDNVQLGIVNQAELKLLPKAFFSFCTAA